MKPNFNNCSEIKGLRFFTKEISPYYCCFLHTKKDSGVAGIHRIDISFPLKPSLTVIPKKAIWQNWCFGQLCHSKTEKEAFILSQFPLVTVFLREREKIFHTYSGPICISSSSCFLKRHNLGYSTFVTLWKLASPKMC